MNGATIPSRWDHWETILPTCSLHEASGLKPKCVSFYPPQHTKTFSEGSSSWSRSSSLTISGLSDSGVQHLIITSPLIESEPTLLNQSSQFSRMINGLPHTGNKLETIIHKNEQWTVFTGKGLKLVVLFNAVLHKSTFATGEELLTPHMISWLTLPPGHHKTHRRSTGTLTW